MHDERRRDERSVGVTEDVEREKNWEWTIEENDNWEKKKAKKARRADFQFHGALGPEPVGLIYIHNSTR